ncbi:DUF3016 domain-containing protein [Neptunicella marina]|uniref:DUF3016 domain-containing protein n=1 Tax=Neptunicella marina TaxID=2125989 RepID=A0A8J6IUJ3_9ALTE|nr:DUF3016 domain-containing protein [Neptunicella marina]MBC3766589.1 DUF3016 domain-containing protein [Neptunicella marina]
MKKFNAKCLTVTALLMASAPVFAQAELDIDWQKPDEYRDVKPVSQTKASYQKHVFKTLAEELTKQLEDLPDGYKLSMTVTNLDLAGEVWPGMMVGIDTSSDIRLVKQMDIPRMDFSYQLTDASGVVVKEGDEELKDMAFMDRGSRIGSRQPLYYEKEMLKRWVRETFSDYMTRK